MVNITTILVFIPIFIEVFKEFPILQKNFKYSVVKGYAYLVGLPIIFTFISSNAINEVFRNSFYINLISGI